MTSFEQGKSTRENVDVTGAGESSSHKETDLEQNHLVSEDRIGEGDIPKKQYLRNKLVAVQYDQSGTIKMSVDHLPLSDQAIPVHYMISPSVPQLNIGNQLYNHKHKSREVPLINKYPSVQLSYHQTSRQKKPHEDLFITDLDKRINKLQTTIQQLKNEMTDDRHTKREARTNYKQKYMPWLNAWASTESNSSLKMKHFSPRSYDWIASPSEEPLPLIPKLPPRNPDMKPPIEGLPITPSPEDLFAQDEILQSRPKYSADIFKRKLYELEELCQNELVRIESTAQLLKKRQSDTALTWPKNILNNNLMENPNLFGTQLPKTETITQASTPFNSFENLDSQYKKNIFNYKQLNSNSSINQQEFPNNSTCSYSFENTMAYHTNNNTFSYNMDSQLQSCYENSTLSQSISPINLANPKLSSQMSDLSSFDPDRNMDISAERFRKILKSCDEIELNYYFTASTEVTSNTNFNEKNFKPNPKNQIDEKVNDPNLKCATEKLPLTFINNELNSYPNFNTNDNINKNIKDDVEIKKTFLEELSERSTLDPNQSIPTMVDDDESDRSSTIWESDIDNQQLNSTSDNLNMKTDVENQSSHSSPDNSELDESDFSKNTSEHHS